MPSAPQSDEWKAMVLTVGSKSWRSIGSCKRPGSLREEMIYLNGFLHCFDHQSYSIHAFNIESERFQEFQVSALRESSSHCFDRLGLGVLEGCLSLTDFKKNDRDVEGVWVMKDYGVKESWTKEFEIRESCEQQRTLEILSGFLFENLVLFFSRGIFIFLLLCSSWGEQKRQLLLSFGYSLR
ncbi:putative F-box associated interaction domain-containing protein [Rosa chinensis]|uniref:Putative F-box associated interaction domain-containing protein n=1 Tax=Rosa chinensis TaxID=74649 RepID=A0A2P6R2J4_ROSCH|nr:putative F-box associated interaction domain-containing protein [Rosa chinensis]